MHKSQGQTLERVKVDLGKVFEHGQGNCPLSCSGTRNSLLLHLAYVALSRATTLAQLEIVNFNPAVIHAHPRVVAWQKQWMPQITTSSSNNSPISGPSRVPSVPARGVTAPIQQTSFEDPEMDCEEAISQYHDHLLAPR
ncbi:hypothetical protein F5890DRAFT_1158065 [Lentinula detonsa]|uniref:Uncharacterized protein n=1 Tax=Lentinula detonsa TaxID=2804962 RepID=A0AA38Q184_9AGAR|nr:hypothetical protein F5890DRAFT_1158065 [Lentinula detonsa]